MGFKLGGMLHLHTFLGTKFCHLPMPRSVEDSRGDAESGGPDHRDRRIEICLTVTGYMRGALGRRLRDRDDGHTAFIDGPDMATVDAARRVVTGLRTEARQEKAFGIGTTGTSAFSTLQTWQQSSQRNQLTSAFRLEIGSSDVEDEPHAGHAGDASTTRTMADLLWCVPDYTLGGRRRSGDFTAAIASLVRVGFQRCRQIRQMSYLLGITKPRSRACVSFPQKIRRGLNTKAPRGPLSGIRPPKIPAGEGRVG